MAIMRNRAKIKAKGVELSSAHLMAAIAKSHGQGHRYRRGEELEPIMQSAVPPNLISYPLSIINALYILVAFQIKNGKCKMSFYCL